MTTPDTRDRGSATVVMVAVVAAVLVLSSSVLAAAAIRGAEVRAQGAADAAALSGAAALVGLVPGTPCSIAATVVVAAAESLASCDTAGSVVRVAVTVRSGPITVGADAVAGPEPAPSPLHR
ncbi:Rv3654c family TadE-like protein [Microbacterium sp. M1A1_1b]